MAKKSKQAQKAAKPAPAPSSTPEPSYKELAGKAFAKGQYSHALNLYNRAINADSQNYLLYSNRSACYMAMEEYENALKDAERVIQLCPNWAKGHFRKGMALEQLMFLEEALQSYKTGLTHAPSDSLLKPSCDELTQLLQQLRLAEQTMLQEDNLRPPTFSSSSSVESKEKCSEEWKEKAVETAAEAKTKTETEIETEAEEVKESKEPDVGSTDKVDEKQTASASTSTATATATATDLDKEELRKKREAYAVFQRMVKWLKSGGARFPKLYLRSYTSSYRGVHVLCDVPKGEVVLAVPERFIITSDMAKASDIGRSIIASGLDLRSHHTYMASFLLQELHKTSPPSFFAPFLPTLPSSFSSLPLSFSEEELRHLEGSFCLQMIADRLYSMQEEFRNLRRYVKEYANFTFAEFEWARRVVITRVFGLMINGVKTDGMVPFADMFNHRPPREALLAKEGGLTADTTWGYDDKRKAFIVSLAQPAKAKQQIFDSYGRKCNSRFFVNYGFTLDHNADNEAVMRVAIPACDPLLSTKKQLLGVSSEYVRRQYQVPIDINDKKVASLFGFVRLAHASEKETTAFATEKKLDVASVKPLSVSNELKALESLQKAAQEALSAFPTTLEEDQKLLDAGIADFNVRNCVVMRKGEKEVLTHYATLYDHVKPLLAMTFKKLRAHLALVKSNVGDNSPSPVEAYLLCVLPHLVSSLRSQGA